MGGYCLNSMQPAFSNDEFVLTGNTGNVWCCVLSPPQFAFLKKGVCLIQDVLYAYKYGTKKWSIGNIQNIPIIR